MTITEPRLLVIGAGTFALSSCYHLIKRGDLKPSEIVLLDRYPAPSEWSAAHDINKTVRTEYGDPIQAKLAREAMQMWQKDALFAPHYHHTGWLYLSPKVAPNLGHSNHFGTHTFDDAIDSAKALTPDAIFDVKTPNAYLKLPGTISEHYARVGLPPAFDSVYGIYNQEAGWAATGDALQALVDHLREIGVTFIDGDAGHVTELLFDDKNQIQGVKCKTGKTWKAGKILLAAGAACEGLLDFRGQIVSGAYSICWIEITKEEADKYRDQPCLAGALPAQIFPPRQLDDGKFVIKIGGLASVRTHKDIAGISRPEYRAERQVSIQDQADARLMVRDFLPEFVDRPFSKTRTCYDAESFDNKWIIDKHPSGLYIAAAGSGHTAKNLPTVGVYVADMLQDKLDPTYAKEWRWRPDVAHIAFDRIDFADMDH